MVVVMVTCQQSQGQGQRSGHLIRRSSGAQSPEVEAGGRSRACRDMSGEFPSLWYQITGKYPALLCVYKGSE